MAEPNNSSDTKKLVLTATYNSPLSEPFAITESLPSLASNSVADKSQYLNTLRKSITATQEQINTELTARMEEDKARDIVSKNGTKPPAVADEAKEEENYGEEVPEEDD